MKKAIILLSLLTVSFISRGQTDYYFPGQDKFNSTIPTPWEFLSYDVGSHHTRYDVIVDYMKILAEKSERVNFEIIGQSVELRPQVMLTITSKDNLAKLEEIRLKHLELSSVSGSDINGADNIPLVIQLGFNVHGNEASGGEASMLAAYFLAASEGNEINDILSNSIIFIEPVLNPDGRDRFTTWANMNRSYPPISDPNDREHNEAWPGGRTNHYWFDLNRDWLPLSQVESKNRMRRYHKWLPNVITDHHEMGTNSTFFFEPTKKGSENPIVTVENYVKLNNLFAKGYAKALNDINHYYDSGRSFDNLYPGYGSSYGDLHGGLALLFEQASSRGLVQKTDLGFDLTYSLGIKNQLFSALTTVRTAVNNQALLNDYMRRFFNDAADEAKNDPVKAYVFGDLNDKNKARYFLDLLLMHNIEVYANSKDIQKDGLKFSAGQSWFVPTEQKQYKMIRTIFESNLNFCDSTFYDATAWAMVYSYGMPFAALGKKPQGEIIDALPEAKYKKPEYSDYGYVFDWSDYNSAKALYYVQSMGLKARSAWDEFSIKTSEGVKNYSRGSVFIPVQYQDMDPQDVFTIVKNAAAEAEISIESITGSVTLEGPWMGNSSFRAINKPEVLMLTGDGVSSSNAGALWHFFDTKLSLPVTKLDISEFSRTNLNKYTSIILPSGGYDEFSESDINRLNDWISSGGNLIAVAYALRFLENSKIAEIKYKSQRADAPEKRMDYDKIRAAYGKHSIGGIFCEADLDISHPLGFGYSKRKITVYRNHTLFVDKDEGPTSNVMIYTEDPLISGFCTDENIQKMKGSASLISLSKGRGNIIIFVNDPVFRGCWYGTNKLLMNAVFFGPEI
ncbi:MAG: M14 family zinc carboxypeptidase [Bacteroidota bacterium]|nr:M14 family zinc carboxypeptidase [Bacteroidota bacterium]